MNFQTVEQGQGAYIKMQGRITGLGKSGSNKYGPWQLAKVTDQAGRNEEIMVTPGKYGAPMPTAASIGQLVGMAIAATWREGKLACRGFLDKPTGAAQTPSQGPPQAPQSTNVPQGVSNYPPKQTFAPKPPTVEDWAGKTRGLAAGNVARVLAGQVVTTPIKDIAGAIIEQAIRLAKWIETGQRQEAPAPLPAPATWQDPPADEQIPPELMETVEQQAEEAGSWEQG